MYLIVSVKFNSILPHRECYTSVRPSLSWGKPCCTWSSFPPGSAPDSGSASSSSRLRSRSCRGSPGRRAEAWTGSFLPVWCRCRSWRRAGRHMCWCYCLLDKRCRSQRCCLMRGGLWLWCWLHSFHTVSLKDRQDTFTNRHFNDSLLSY